MSKNKTQEPDTAKGQSLVAPLPVPAPASGALARELVASLLEEFVASVERNYGLSFRLLRLDGGLRGYADPSDCRVYTDQFLLAGPILKP